MGVATGSGAETTPALDPESIAPQTAAGVFFRQAAKLTDKVLFRHWRDERWHVETWTSMRTRALAVASALLEAGVQPGDRVIIFGPNSLEWLVSDIAIATVGAVSVPIYPSTIAETAQLIADNSQAVLALVADVDTGSRLRTGGDLKRIVAFDTEFQDWMRRRPDDRMREIVERLHSVETSQLGTIIYTSGTTGEPKGVMLSHGNLYATALRTVHEHKIGEDAVSLSFLPYAHSFERMVVMSGMIAGGSAWLSRGKEKLQVDLGEASPTFFPSVPMIYEKMYRLVQEEAASVSPVKQRIFKWAVDVAHRRLDASRTNPLLTLQFAIANALVLKAIRTRLSGRNIRFFASGGAPLSEHIERFFWALDIPILQGWGLTETAAAATLNTFDHHRFGTVGKAIPDTEIKIAEDGEILVKGPGVMQGYFRDEEATNDVFVDGWFRTGDIGEVDKDGFVKITDRKKDLIKTAGGKYVAPQGIEAKLQNERYIERVVVIGDERPYVTALIVPNFEELGRDGMPGDPGQAAKDEKVRRAIQERIDNINRSLDHFEAIQYFEVLERDLDEQHGELTPTLKPKRRVITENYAELIEGMYKGRQKPGHGAHADGEPSTNGTGGGAKPAETEAIGSGN